MCTRQSSIARGDSDSGPWLLAADRGGPAGRTRPAGPIARGATGVAENSGGQRANACPSHVKVVDPNRWPTWGML